MSKSSYIIALSTFSTKKQAEKASKILIKEGLAACVNIIDRVNSIYRWEDKIVSDKVIFMDNGGIIDDCSKQEFFETERSVRTNNFLDKILND